MNRKEHLIAIAAEEAVEVAHRATKMLRFGINEVEPGQSEDNGTRLVREYIELTAVIEMLAQEGMAPRDGGGRIDFQAVFDAKIARVEKFLEYSHRCGTLTEWGTLSEIPFADLADELKRRGATVTPAPHGGDFEEVR